MLHILLAFKKNLVLFLNKSKVQIYREEKQIGLNGAVVGRGGGWRGFNTYNRMPT